MTERGYDRDRHAVNIAWQVVRTKYGRIYDPSWEDLAAVALVRVYERAKTFDPTLGSWASFVRRHATYGIQDELRRIHGRGSTPSRKLPVVSMETPIGKTEDGMPILLATVLGCEDPALATCPFFTCNLRRALERLPHRQGEAARLMLLGLDVNEAAEYMQIRGDYSNALRSWARAALRKDPDLVGYSPAR